MFERVCLVHYHEIGLKGRNRSVFERRLQENLDAALVGLPVGRVERIASRLVGARARSRTRRSRSPSASLGSPASQARLAGATGPRRCPSEMEEAALAGARRSRPVRHVRVEARRSNTDYPESSMEMNRRIGAFLQAETGAGVEPLGSPTSPCASIVTGRGLRLVGARTGRRAACRSAPRVASSRCSRRASTRRWRRWRMMRRGAVVVGRPLLGPPADQRRRPSVSSHEIGERARADRRSWAHLRRALRRPAEGDLAGRAARPARAALPPAHDPVAEAIARVERAKALVTGESLGQVASQTLENIAAVDEAATLPVLRPLIGSDKLEIIGEARRIGTYELSTQEHADCCTLFMPRSPETHAKMPAVLEAWSALDVERMVADALASIELARLRAVASYRAAQAVAFRDRRVERQAGCAEDTPGMTRAADPRARALLRRQPPRRARRPGRSVSTPSGRCSRCPPASGSGGCAAPPSRWPTAGRARLAPSASSGRAPFDLVFASTFVNLAEFRGLAGAARRGGARHRLLPREPARLPQPPHRRVGLPVPAHQHHHRARPPSAACSTRAGTSTASSPRSPASSREFPDHHPQGRRRADRREVRGARAAVRPDAVRRAPSRRAGPRCRIVWPHRWEHDKNPEAFFAAVGALAEEGLDFEVAVAGQSFRETAGGDARGRGRLGARLVHCDEPANRASTRRCLRPQTSPSPPRRTSSSASRWSRRATRAARRSCRTGWRIRRSIRASSATRVTRSWWRDFARTSSTARRPARLDMWPSGSPSSAHASVCRGVRSASPVSLSASC